MRIQMNNKFPTMGLDCSTNSLAFAFVKNGKLLRYGEIFFNGPDVYHRASDARKKIEAIKHEFEISCVAIEKTIHVRSIDTAIKMAFVAGTVISCLLEDHVRVLEIAPISWQSGIGNPNLTSKEKLAIQKANPGKSKNWYMAKNRDVRKNRTRQWVKSTFSVDIQSDNITDAIGLAWYSENMLSNQ
jgi:Holliday junction resolvasome RuvABC endonuclease subunit